MGRLKWGSVGLAVILSVALVIWMTTGDVRIARSDAAGEQEPVSAAVLPSVQFEQRMAETFQPDIRLQGQLEPWRQVQVVSRVAGLVESLDVRLGDSVGQGQRLLRLSEDERPAAVARSRARVAQLEADLAATRRLRSENLASESERLRLESELAAARAELRQAALALDYQTPEAPFDSIVNHRYVELGTFVQTGEPLFDLVRTDVLKVTGFVPQQLAGQVREGQKVLVETLDGRRLEGSLTFIASAADRESRSFRIEARVENPDGLRVAGGSASLRIQLPERQAHFLSPSLLSLADDGRPGVLVVGEEDRVALVAVELLSIRTEGAWVSGLPSPARVITRGGGFVAQGQKVQPVSAVQEDAP